MVYEIAMMPIQEDRVDTFKRAFCEVTYLLSRAKGYLSHVLMRGETPSRFTLFVRWESLEDHTQGFEPSRDHELFMSRIEEYLAGEPVVFHVH